MQPNSSVKTTVLRVANKEISLFFASPIAYIFLATFAAITLFVFFWGESFFARNIADVRPLFEWMPVLLIFLSATLTMRLWSEERRSGTLEHVLTQAVPLWHFVVGKFLGCLFLLAIALLITLPLPITIDIISDLDWGPVLAGYVATLLMGAAYLSIGLFVSSRSDNQIVSLIGASVLGGIFYVIGTDTVTNLFGFQGGEWLRLLGSGSRFDSIARGVLDLRDLYYYLSIVLIFLGLNTYALERERWSKKSQRSMHRQWYAVTMLLIVNAIGGNLWLGQLNNLRMDVTAGRQFSISDATKGYLAQLQEPLLIRGYFSSKTHPLLAPLVPQMRDLIKEYEIAGKGHVRSEFVDPLIDLELEQEANQKFDIQPVPFQVADRYQSSIVSSYFNVLVQYGDKYEVLTFQDLIEAKARSESEVDVQLRNPEHDLTRIIKKVLHSYQAGGNLFDTVSGKLVFHGYISSDTRLPNELKSFKKDMLSIVDEFVAQSNNRFSVSVKDPEDNNGTLAQEIALNYGFTPMSAGVFSSNRFYFYMLLSRGDQLVQIPFSGVDKDGFRKNLEAGIKRFAKGFTKTVALVTPKQEEQVPGHGHGRSRSEPAARFSQLQQFIGNDVSVQYEDLSDGLISANVDVLFLAAPKELDEKALFAIDQFLMQGGTVIAATSPYRSTIEERGLRVTRYDSGLEAWLKHHGLEVGTELVLDTQNAPFPIPFMRNVGGFQVRDMKMLDYPYFIDVRAKGLNQNNLITSELPQTTVAWASPIKLDSSKNNERTVTELLRSSPTSWLSSSLDVMPQVSASGFTQFKAEGEQSSKLLGVISQGRFDSYFAGKTSPLTPTDSLVAASDEKAERSVDKPFNLGSVIERSPDSARIILVSSNDFLRDQTLQYISSTEQAQYVNSLQFAANAIDWSLDDSGLMSIRSRGHFNRTLPPMERSVQMFWEYLNYGLATLALIAIAIFERRKRLVKHKLLLTLLAD